MLNRALLAAALFVVGGAVAGCWEQVAFSGAQIVIEGISSIVSDEGWSATTRPPNSVTPSTMSAVYLCRQALPVGAAFKNTWDTRSAYASYVAEAKRRGYSVASCRQAAGYPAQMTESPVATAASMNSPPGPTYCYDPAAGLPYLIATGGDCVGADRQLSSKIDYDKLRAKYDREHVGTIQTVKTDGAEKKVVTGYCFRKTTGKYYKGTPACVGSDRSVLYEEYSRNQPSVAPE